MATLFLKLWQQRPLIASNLFELHVLTFHRLGVLNEIFRFFLLKVAKDYDSINSSKRTFFYFETNPSPLLFQNQNMRQKANLLKDGYIMKINVVIKQFIDIIIKRTY